MWHNLKIYTLELFARISVKDGVYYWKSLQII